MKSRDFGGAYSPSLGRSIVVAAFALSLANCGEHSKSRHPSDPIIEQRTTQERPVEFSLSDTTCQDQAVDVKLETTTVYRWKGATSTQEKARFAQVYSGESLASDLVQETVYGEDYSRLCDWSKLPDDPCTGANGRQLPWRINAGAKSLRICDGNKTYDRKSYEATALTSVFYLEQAFQHYNDIDKGTKPLAKIGLSILPSFTEFYDHYTDDETGAAFRLKTFLTHNLAYFSEPPSITVYPEDTLHEAQAGGNYLWESPFVLAHEFGHHIDIDRNGDALLAMGLRWNPFLHHYDDLLAESLGMDGSTARAAISGSVAEGVADLLAYYSLGGSSDTLVGLPCFGLSRDVGNATFGKDSQGRHLDKILTVERLNILFGVAFEDSAKTCGDVSFDDIHTIGAIIAFTLDRSFRELTASSAAIKAGSPEDFNARYELTLSWLDEFRKRSRAVREGAMTSEILAPFTPSFEYATRTWLSGASLKDTEGASEAAVLKSICSIVGTQIPVLERAPFATATLTCD